MIRKSFDKNTLLEILEEEADGYTLLENEIVDTSRWFNIFSIVFKDKTTGKFYSTDYRVGATECQDEGPWEYQDAVMCTEVEPVEVTVTQYHNVKGNQE